MLTTKVTNKPETRQEMAEWLAREVLGNTVGVFINGCFRTDLVGAIYSPDGFFAVWNAVEAMRVHLKYEFNFDAPPKSHRRHFQIVHWIKDKPIQGTSLLLKTMETIEDRYDAFYSAVYEAKEETK